MRLRIATGHGAPGLFHDDGPLEAAFTAKGITVDPMPWRHIEAEGDPVLVRTPWDYTDDRDRFRAWLQGLHEAGTPCVNPPGLMLWNLDKRYLLRLEEQGHDIVPARLLPTYDPDAVRHVMMEQGWKEAVAKPAVGAGAEGLVRFGADGRAETPVATGNTWLTRIEEEPHGNVLVQPLMPSIIKDGEWSLFYFAGQYSHAILKAPAGGDIRVQEEHGGTTRAATPPEATRAASDAIVRDVPDAVYARVDGVVEDGTFLLMELELIEPELYFRYCPEGVGPFVDAVATALS